MASEACERFHVANMDSPSCVQKIQGRVVKLDGVLQAKGSPISRTLTVELDRALTDRRALLGDADELLLEVARGVYDCVRYAHPAREDAVDGEAVTGANVKG